MILRAKAGLFTIYTNHLGGNLVPKHKHSFKLKFLLGRHLATNSFV